VLIAFASDYGYADEFVGVCKAVMLGLVPDVRIIDLGHDIPPHNVRAGALLLVRSVQYLPDDSIVMAVVDPGVGTDRRLIGVEVAGGILLGPDNGLLAPAVALGALALLWHLLSGRGQHVADTTKPPVEQTTSPTGEAPYAGLLTKLQGIKAGDTDVGQLATSAVNDLYSSLVGIKDETSAQAGLAGLTKASSEFDQLSGLLSQLSPENRKALADTFASIRSNLDTLLDRALAIPGAATIIKPTVDAIRSKLDSLTAV
jgi:hypothetical protein